MGGSLVTLATAVTSEHVVDLTILILGSADRQAPYLVVVTRAEEIQGVWECGVSLGNVVDNYSLILYNVIEYF